MEDVRDVYGWQQRLDGSLRRIAESEKISEQNKKTILGFIENYKKKYRKKKNKELSDATIGKAVDRLLTIGEVCGKQNFKSINSEEKMDKLIGKIESRKYKPNTMKTIKIYIKMLWRFLRFDNCYHSIDPPETMNVKIVAEEEKITEDDVMSDEQFLKVISLEKDLQFRALFYTQRFTGVREQEIIRMSIGDVKKDELGCRINVVGKTGPYSARVLDHWKILLEWIQKNPGKDDANSPLWIIRKRKITYDENGKKIVQIVNAPMQYKTVFDHWKMLQLRAGFAKSKSFSLHNLRKQNTTWMLRQGYSSDIINAQQGRKPGSRAISRYAIWNDAKAVDNEFAKRNGKTEKLPTNKLAMKVCIVCGEENLPHNDYCEKCFRPLDIKEALKIAEENKVLLDEKVAETIKETVRTTIIELYPDKKDELGQIFEEMDKHPRQWFEKQVEKKVEKEGAERRLVSLNYQPANSGNGRKGMAERLERKR